MITSEQVQASLQQYFGNIGAVTALDADPAFPNDPPRFAVAITGGKIDDAQLGARFLKAIQDKTGYLAEFVLLHGQPRGDVIHVAVPSILDKPSFEFQERCVVVPVTEPPLDTQETVEVAVAPAEASVDLPGLTDLNKLQPRQSLYQFLKISGQAVEPCQNCDGTGKLADPDDDHLIDCPDCAGTGIDVMADAVKNPDKYPQPPAVDEPLPDLDAPPAGDPRDLRIADLLTCVKLLDAMLDEDKRQSIEDQQTIHALHLVNQAQSQMLREAVLMTEPKQPTVEVCTLDQNLDFANIGKADSELARELSAGWQVLHVAVYIEQDSTSTTTWRTVTLIREVTAPAQPQPEQRASAEFEGVMNRAARNGMPAPIPRPNRTIIDRQPVPSYAQSFAQQFPIADAIQRGGVDVWKAQQNAEVLASARQTFTDALAGMPSYKPLPAMLKAGE